ncbi:MAG: T9SS type A sorting domain-containing protein [Chitinophagales bacterium]|nr:T9SS type A sorting domain-containing protein [Chitinophagales bacterium]
MSSYRNQLRVIAICLICLLATCIYAQKEDYIWLQGYQSDAGYDSGWQHLFGISQFNFNQSPMVVTYDSLGINFSKTNTSYCNSDGNLLFYTNGIQVRNSLDEIIENADSLNWGWLITNFDQSISKGGYRTTQGIFVLPSPTTTNEYYILNTLVDSNNSGFILDIPQIRYHLLNMNANTGHGQMIERDKVALNGSLSSWEMAAIKHGNGRDWWVLAREVSSNCYYRLLLAPNGINVLPKYCSGTSVPFEVGSFAVSPDGSKLAHFNIGYGINIFDFDRCNGDLINPVSIPIPFLIDSGWGANGAAISPNNRFLYIGITKYVLQYDLQAADIAASVDTVAIYDGFQAPFGSFFHTMQLGPDGKIYESCGGGETVYHVINQPDKKGDSCEFVQHGIQLPSPSLGVPNFPNYRLGALPGSPCDTLGTSISQLATRNPQLTIFPNPATEFVVIDYATAADWSKGELHLFIYDTKGAVIHEQPLPMYSGFQKITCTQWPSGVYQATIKRRETTIATGRVVKQ